MAGDLTQYFELPKLPKIKEPTDDDIAESVTASPKSNIQRLLDKGDGEVKNEGTPPMTPESGSSTDELSADELTVEKAGTLAAYPDTESDDNHDDSVEEMPLEADATGNADNLGNGPNQANGEESGQGLEVEELCLMSLGVWISAFLFIVIVIGVIGRHGILLGASYKKYDLKLVAREKWDTSITIDPWTSFKANRVVVTHTETDTCDTDQNCFDLLNELKDDEGFFDYNFLVTSNGYIYEMLGWQRSSPLFPDTPTMVVAFLGNYETISPDEVQIEQFKNLLETSEQLHYLAHGFVIEAMKSKTEPKMLYSYISKMRNWDKERHAIFKAISELKLYFEL